MTVSDQGPATPATPPSSAHSLARIDQVTCIELLRTEQVGRLALADHSGPDIMPVNYAMDGDDILIATTAFGTIADEATDRPVAFEVDHVDASTHTGWSVVVRGTAHRRPLFEEAGEPAPDAWADGPRSYVLRIRPDSVTGRRLTGHSHGVVGRPGTATAPPEGRQR
jgi:hypothetical protein